MKIIVMLLMIVMYLRKGEKKDFPEKIYHDDQYHHGALRHILKHLRMN